jgi:hypothetical protein
MAEGSVIESLPLISSIDSFYSLPAMKDGQTVRLTVGQVLELLVDGAGSSFDTLKKIEAALGAKLNINLSNADGSFASGLKWMSKGIGELYSVDESMPGADVPPTNDARFRFAKLTAGLTGAGQYNNGVLTTENVSGSAPLVSATALISLTGSPLNGRTIRLINTEGRYIRPGTSPGSIEQDAFQGHIHDTLILNTASAAGSSAGIANANSAGSSNTISARTGTPIADGTNGTPRTASETRVKGLQHSQYMRVR